MSTESTSKPITTLRCPGCGDEAGPFDLSDGLCEDCERLVPTDGDQ